MPTIGGEVKTFSLYSLVSYINRGRVKAAFSTPLRRSRSSAVYEGVRRIIMTFKKKKYVPAFTLTEVMVAILIVTIVVTGGSYLFITGQNSVKMQKHYRAAAHLAAQKLEELKASSYSSVLAGTDSDDVPLEEKTYTLTTEVVDSGSYKEITVTVTWQEGRLTRTVDLVTLVAP